MKLIICIPAYNEEKTIGDVIRNIPRTIPGISETEIIVIDDGSRDRTAEIARQAGAKVFQNGENKGLGKTFQVGIHRALLAKADIVCTIDGDAQFNSAEIPSVIHPLIFHEADFVSGNRFHAKEKKFPFMKKVGNKCMAWWISRLTKLKINDSASGFRAYTREALLNLNLFGKFNFSQESMLDLLYKGFRLKEIPVEVKPARKYGHSIISGNLFRYAWQAFKIIFRIIRDYRPLKYIGGFGIALCGLGFLAELFLLAHYLKTDQFTPYKFVGFTGGFFMSLGVLIFVVGLVADMLNRIRATQEKLLYFEKKNFYDNNGPHANLRKV